jgi:hypothetical protein
MDVPRDVATRTETNGIPASVSSTLTMVSAPAGTIAPVMMRAASPGPTGRLGASPAAISAITGRRTGAWAVAAAMSAARTAYPSMAELSKPGRSTRDATSVAATSPAASLSGTTTGGSGRAAAST